MARKWGYTMEIRKRAHTHTWQWLIVIVVFVLQILFLKFGAIFLFQCLFLGIEILPDIVP